MQMISGLADDPWAASAGSGSSMQPYPPCWNACVDAWQVTGDGDQLVACRRGCLSSAGCTSEACQAFSSLFGNIAGFFTSGTPFGVCVDDCNNKYPDPDQNDACFRRCAALPGGIDRYGEIDVTTTLPGGIVPTTYGNLPLGLKPPPGYQPQPKINWWRLGGAAVIGLAGVGAYLLARRGVGHHAA